MSVFFILFFISLASIAGMIGRKVLLMKRAGISGMLLHHETHFEAPDLEEMKHIAKKTATRAGYIALVSVLRFSIKGSHVVKQKSREAIEFAKQKLARRKAQSDKPKEVSRFLRTMSEYKHKIRKIKKQIKEEENIV